MSSAREPRPGRWWLPSVRQGRRPRRRTPSRAAVCRCVERLEERLLFSLVPLDLTEFRIDPVAGQESGYGDDFAHVQPITLAQGGSIARAGTIEMPGDVD